MGEEQTQRTTQEKRERTASCRASEKRKTRVIEYKERIRSTRPAELDDVEGLSILYSKCPNRKHLKLLIVKKKSHGF